MSREHDPEIDLGAAPSSADAVAHGTPRPEPTTVGAAAMNLFRPRSDTLSAMICRGQCKRGRRAIGDGRPLGRG